MSSTIKNIIILAVVAVALGLAYFFFLKPAPEQSSLTTTGATTGAAGVGVAGSTTVPESQFLSVLLNVTNIQLNDSIFSDPAFISLHDSSIELISDVPEGRPNPFAPIGSDVVVTPPTTTTTSTTSTTTTTPSNTTTPPTTPSPKP